VWERLGNPAEVTLPSGHRHDDESAKNPAGSTIESVSLTAKGSSSMACVTFCTRPLFSEYEVFEREAAGVFLRTPVAGTPSLARLRAIPATKPDQQSDEIQRQSRASAR